MSASPAEQLAAAIGADLDTPTLLRKGQFLVMAGPTGIVRVIGPGARGRVIGTWSDPTDSLAAGFRDVTGVTA